MKIQPHGHEEDDVICDPEESLEPDFHEESEDEAKPAESSEPRGDEGMPWEGREYAQGPPELEPEALLGAGQANGTQGARSPPWHARGEAYEWESMKKKVKFDFNASMS